MGRGTRELHECGRRSVQAAGTSEEGPAGRDIVLRTTEFSYIMSSCHCVCDLEWCATTHVARVFCSTAPLRCEVTCWSE